MVIEQDVPSRDSAALSGDKIIAAPRCPSRTEKAEEAPLCAFCAVDDKLPNPAGWPGRQPADFAADCTSGRVEMKEGTTPFPPSGENLSIAYYFSVESRVFIYEKSSKTPSPQILSNP